MGQIPRSRVHLGPGILAQLLFVMVLAIILIALCRRLKFPPIIGYILVGLIISIIDHHSLKHLADVQVLAQYGVVFLLFSIGLEFSLPHLMAMKKAVFHLGGLQMLICGLTAYFICLQLKIGLEGAFVIAVSLAMSSTAIISKILTETGEFSTTTGRLTMSMLIFQDLMVIPAIIITGFFAEKTMGDSNLVVSLVVDLMKGIFTFTVLVMVGKKIFTPIFREIARGRSPELFTLATLFIVLGAAYFSNLMGMSYEFGAFLAGAMIGGTPYQHQIESDIRPFRDVLLGLFFIGIGALIDINVLVAHFAIIIGIAFAIFFGKFFVITYLVRWMKLGFPLEATKTGLLLAQAGEFGFVLMTSALHDHFIAHGAVQILLLAIIMSMLISMMSLRFQAQFLGPLTRVLFHLKKEAPSTLQNAEVEPGSIIIAGFSRVGQWVAKAVTMQGHHYLAMDLDPARVEQARLAGENVVYADASDSNVLRNIHIDKARAMVLTFQDPIMSLKVLQQIRLLNTNIPVLVRTHDDKDIERLLAAGATEVIPDALEASLMMSLHLLVSLGMDLTQAMHWSDNLRRNRYKLLKGYFAGEAEIRAVDESATWVQQRAIEILPGQFAEGKTLHDIGVTEHGVEMIAMRKNGIVGPAPSAQAEVHAGDVLIVSGLTENIDRFAWYLEHGE